MSILASGKTTLQGLEIGLKELIYVGGSFTTNQGVEQNGILRIFNSAIDRSFNIGTGFGSGVNSLTIQPDGKIVAVGAFTTY